MPDRRDRVVIAAAIVLALVVWFVPFRTAAQAVPARAEPPIDQAVPVMPSIVDVWFSEAVNPDGTMLEVLTADGGRVDLGDTQLDPQDPARTHVTVGVHAGLDNGVYVVHWTAVSAVDGATTSGDYQFTVDPGASPQTLPQVASQQSPAQLAEIDPNAKPVRSGRDRLRTGTGVAAVALLALGLLLLWFFRRPARGRRWRDDVVDRL